MDTTRFASSLSTDSDAAVAEGRCVESLLRDLGGEPDLLLFFVTHHYATALDDLSKRLARATGARVAVGCTGASIVGGDREVEHSAALSLWGARLPDTSVRPVHLVAEHLPDDRFRFSPELDVRDPARAAVILLGDPFTFPAHVFLPWLEGELPGVPVIGGMASGGQGPHQHLLWRDDELYDHGALAVVLEGATEVVSAVSQGCRPVGEPLVITACEDNLITRLRGRGAAKVMFEMIGGLPSRDRELFRRGAHVGLAIDATKRSFQAEDLLVRNVLGIRPQNDAIAVGDDSLRPGQTVQFMVRDAASASDELRRILASRASDWTPVHPGAAGALLFTCGGRGAHLFRTLHHDAGAIQEHVGPRMPLAGFFANGEIGPVGGRSFLHGFTASMALVRSRRGR